MVLAHPGALSRGWRIPDAAIAGLAAAGLAGLEVDHPDHDAAERARLRGLAADLGLLTTGGSDDHGSLTGHRLGCETTSPAAFERLMALGQNPVRRAGLPGAISHRASCGGPLMGPGRSLRAFCRPADP